MNTTTPVRPTSRRPTHPTRRRVLAGLGAGTLAALAGCSASARTTPESVVATSTYRFADIPIAVAVEEVLQSVDGNVAGTIQDLTTTNLQVAALLSGDVHVYTSGAGALYQAIAAGHELRIVGTKLAGTDYAIAVREEVDSLAAFADSNLKMGVSSIGGLSYVQTVGMLQAAGVDPADVTFVTVGSSSDRRSALAAGRIDGSPLHEGQLWGMQQEGAAVKNAGNVRDVFPTFVENAIAVSAEWLDSPDGDRFVHAFSGALVRTNERATTDFDWVYGKTTEYLVDPVSEEEARMEWNLNRDIGRWPSGELDRTGYDDVLGMMTGAGLLDEDAVDLDTVFRPEYVRTAIASL